MRARLEAKDGVRGCCNVSEKMTISQIKLGAKGVSEMDLRNRYEARWRTPGD